MKNNQINICNDCKIDTTNIGEFYMLKHTIWNSIATKKEILCISCIEKRLKRQLIATDFLDCKLNRDLSRKRSQKLKNRMEGIKNEM